MRTTTPPGLGTLDRITFEPNKVQSVSESRPENEVLSQLESLARTVFGRDDIVVNRETTARDIDEWDSLTHVQFILVVEQHFQVTFTMRQVASFASVGDLVDAILNG